jgi:hypothetical protein
MKLVNWKISQILYAGFGLLVVLYLVSNVINAEISAASTEQSSGVAQVGEAVTQMDQATQQNAALVEQMAAAAAGLRSQAHDLVSMVKQFKLSTSHSGGSAGSLLRLSH